MIRVYVVVQSDGDQWTLWSETPAAVFFVRRHAEEHAEKLRKGPNADASFWVEESMLHVLPPSEDGSYELVEV